ncbi:MAG: phosphoribosylformylglycinamidine synthase subunit PurS [bacterium]|nr:phosphoribosylformylglycinamidine synthase subunit PurS [bacterium]
MEELVKATVIVELKDGVLDPQGQAIQQLLVQRGYSQIEQVRVGKKVEFELSGVSVEQGRTMLAEVADKLLANPIIEQYRIELE